MIEVTEMFRAFQGEGPNIGRPSLFVRLRRCTLHCGWCDTKYSWDKNDPGFQDYTTYDSPARLAEAMEAHTNAFAPVHAVVLTGGEPLIWQREMADALTLYRSVYPVPVEVETSGTIVPSDEMLRLCHFNVSHKLPSAKNDNVPKHRLWNEQAVRRILLAGALLLDNVCFKPVVDSRMVEDTRAFTDYLEWLRGIGDDLGIPWRERMRERIYVMPQATSAEELIVAQKFAIQLANAYHVRCTTRMHILAFGNTKGT